MKKREAIQTERGSESYIDRVSISWKQYEVEAAISGYREALLMNRFHVKKSPVTPQMRRNITETSLKVLNLETQRFKEYNNTAKEVVSKRLQLHMGKAVQTTLKTPVYIPGNGMAKGRWGSMINLINRIELEEAIDGLRDIRWILPSPFHSFHLHIREVLLRWRERKMLEGQNRSVAWTFLTALQPFLPSSVPKNTSPFDINWERLVQNTEQDTLDDYMVQFPEAQPFWYTSSPLSNFRGFLFHFALNVVAPMLRGMEYGINTGLFHTEVLMSGKPLRHVPPLTLMDDSPITREKFQLMKRVLYELISLATHGVTLSQHIDESLVDTTPIFDLSHPPTDAYLDQHYHPQLSAIQTDPITKEEFLLNITKKPIDMNLTDYESVRQLYDVQKKLTMKDLEHPLAEDMESIPKGYLFYLFRNRGLNSWDRKYPLGFYGIEGRQSLTVNWPEDLSFPEEEEIGSTLDTVLTHIRELSNFRGDFVSHHFVPVVLLLEYWKRQLQSTGRILDVVPPKVATFNNITLSYEPQKYPLVILNDVESQLRHKLEDFEIWRSDNVRDVARQLLHIQKRVYLIRDQKKWTVWFWESLLTHDDEIEFDEFSWENLHVELQKLLDLIHQCDSKGRSVLFRNIHRENYGVQPYRNNMGRITEAIYTMAARPYERDDLEDPVAMTFPLPAEEHRQWVRERNFDNVIMSTTDFYSQFATALMVFWQCWRVLQREPAIPSHDNEQVKRYFVDNNVIAEGCPVVNAGVWGLVKGTGMEVPVDGEGQPQYFYEQGSWKSPALQIRESTENATPAYDDTVITLPYRIRKEK